MIESLFTEPSPLFIFNSPQEWILVAAACFLLFGANKLPELAKSLGQTRKAFKEGMREAEEDERAEAQEKASRPVGLKPPIMQLDDAALLEELRRRESAKQLETNEIGNAPKL